MSMKTKEGRKKLAQGVRAPLVGAQGGHKGRPYT